MDSITHRPDAEFLDPYSKGLPPTSRVTADTIGSQGWNIRRGDTSTPVAVLRTAALDANVDIMRRYCEAAGVSLAPHAKTTMSPQLLDRQLAAGAWGLTAALPAQARRLWSFGARRVLLANEVTDPAELHGLCLSLDKDPSRELLFYVDSVDGVRIAEDAAEAAGSAGRRLAVLIELGHEAGRTGARTLDEALTVAEAAAKSRLLDVVGVAGYEGTIGHDRTPETLGRVDTFLTGLRDLATAMAERGLLRPGREVIATAGGSSFFDRVTAILGPLGAEGFRVVLRSGCYLIHDHGQYAALTPSTTAEWALPAFRPALEIWTTVLSRPEPGLALVNAGRRDLSHDAGLPVPLAAWRKAAFQGAAVDLMPGAHISALSDQHAFLRIDPASPLAVGDLVALGVSHPCTTLDRWNLLMLVNEDYDVTGAARTYF
jgi:D-serine dehydratase